MVSYQWDLVQGGYTLRDNLWVETSTQLTGTLSGSNWALGMQTWKIIVNVYGWDLNYLKCHTTHTYYVFNSGMTTCTVASGYSCNATIALSPNTLYEISADVLLSGNDAN